MKKILPFLFCTLFTITANSQDIPNPGYENWIQNFDYSEPEGWGTLNLLGGLFGNPFTVFQDSLTPYAGTYALQLTTTVLTNNPDTVNLRDTIGVLFSGSLSFSSQVFGFPYTQTPDKFNFYYKYFPSGNDTAFCNVQLFKWNSTTGMRDTLASGYFNQPAATGSYAHALVDLVYNGQFSGINPDTAMITFSASSDYIPMPGSSLFIDEMSFSGNVGIEEQALSKVLTYPNPASNELNLKFSNTESAKVVIFDVGGKAVLKSDVTSKEIKLTVSSLINGLYFYKTFDKNNAVVSSGKFNIAR